MSNIKAYFITFLKPHQSWNRIARVILCLLQALGRTLYYIEILYILYMSGCYESYIIIIVCVSNRTGYSRNEDMLICQGSPIGTLGMAFHHLWLSVGCSNCVSVYLYTSPKKKMKWVWCEVMNFLVSSFRYTCSLVLYTSVMGLMRTCYPLPFLYFWDHSLCRVREYWKMHWL